MRAVTADQRSHSESFINDAIVFFECVRAEILTQTEHLSVAETDLEWEKRWAVQDVVHQPSPSWQENGTARRKESTLLQADPLLKDLQSSHFSSWHHRVTTLHTNYTHFRVLLQLTAMNKRCVHVRLQVDRAEKLTVYSVAKWLAPPPAVHCCTTLNALFVSVAVFINISLHAFWKYIGSPEMVFAFFNNRISAQLQNDTDTLYKTWRNSICSCKNVDVKHQQINWTPLFSSSASSSSATWHHHIFAA